MWLLLGRVDLGVKRVWTWRGGGWGGRAWDSSMVDSTIFGD